MPGTPRPEFPYHLIPAHGRDYTSRAAFEKDLYAGMDFIAAGLAGRFYCTITDIPDRAKVQIRYGRLEQITIITIDHRKKAKR